MHRFIRVGHSCRLLELPLDSGVHFYRPTLNDQMIGCRVFKFEQCLHSVGFSSLEVLQNHSLSNADLE